MEADDDSELDGLADAEIVTDADSEVVKLKERDDVDEGDSVSL